MNEQSGGYIRLYRRLLEHPVWTTLSPAVLKVMLAFLLKANWKTAAWYDGSQQIEIPRGSFITSYPKMAEMCRLSMKQTRMAFAHLERLQFAAYSRAHKWTMVTVLNYESYQATEDDEGTIEGSLRARSGHDEGTMRAPIEEVKKNKNKYTPSAGDFDAFPFDTDNLPFTAPLDPRPVSEMVNGKTHFAGAAKNGNGHAPKLPANLKAVAERIHARHPNDFGRRDCSAAQVEKKLAAILKHGGIPASGQEAYLERIDRNHEAMCASETWQKDGGQYVKGLENWLAPTKGRYEVAPEATADNELPRMVL